MSFGADWYAVAVAEGLEPGTSAGARLFDKEIVVWRDAAGVAHAWEDRCPHRGMRLSFGFVRGDRIACLYHGWQYDAAGQCRYIPAHPELNVPAAIRTTVFASSERLGMVWVYSDLGNVTPPDPPPERAPMTPVRSIYHDRPAETVAEHLLAGDVPPFAGAAPRTAVARPASLMSLTFENAELVAALQPVGQGRSALHLAIAGRGEDWRGSGQRKVAQWAQDLRRHLHDAAAPPTP
jgi:nitrite reductase/ring-hydroxylating ferredoxin subunit